jgi:hypothetical protein
MTGTLRLGRSRTQRTQRPARQNRQNRRFTPDLSVLAVVSRSRQCRPWWRVDPGPGDQSDEGDEKTLCRFGLMRLLRPVTALTGEVTGEADRQDLPATLLA